MDTLLDALQEGRLFELPESDKTHALRFLASILEAFPEVPAGTDVVGDVIEREKAANTAFGKGWACSQARVPFDEDLMCVIGWSPQGIDYGAPDGAPVKLVVLYLVPANQRNHHLREISSLAEAVDSFPAMDKLMGAQDLDDVRNYLLDLIGFVKQVSGSDARARMIRLQARPSTAALAVRDLSNLLIEPVTVITGSGLGPIALTQNADVLRWLGAAEGLADKLETAGVYEDGGWRLIRRGAVLYEGGRIAHECVAIRLLHGANGGRNGST